MAEIEIRELTVPKGKDAPGWEELVAHVGLLNLITRETTDSDDVSTTPDQLIAQFSNPYAKAIVLVATEAHSEHAIGYAHFVKDHGQQAAWGAVGVAPDHRRRGTGNRLAEALIAVARSNGASVLQSGSTHTDLESEPRLPSPAGPGSVPAGAPSTRLLLAHGFRLGQVEVTSARPLPVADELLERLSEQSRPSDEYELIDWIGPVPEEFIEQYARMRTIASTAVPSGELTEEEQVWDADRVKVRNQQLALAGDTVVTTVARHRGTGEFVGFTGLAFPTASDGRAVGQGYTMIIPEHRGHNLGMRIKINNLRRLNRLPHGAGRIVTGNAGENEAMLRINRALEFRPFLTQGWWEKKLSDPT